ncbi:MAG: S-layer homology domain-containing protein, partial [Acidimicrobiia bacterium]|nr:S-layer homology domain-containing protein [Acidimicrobiia bacterium]MDX2468322.1 S-layer homology domain-containing protein [Acidimicrobiia bacterium]
RALGLTDDAGGNTFTDDDGSVFELDIAKLAAAGITKGCNPPTNNNFCPLAPVTREQMAAFIHRAESLGSPEG